MWSTSTFDALRVRAAPGPHHGRAELDLLRPSRSLRGEGPAPGPGSGEGRPHRGGRACCRTAACRGALAHRPHARLEASFAAPAGAPADGLVAAPAGAGVAMAPTQGRRVRVVDGSPVTAMGLHAMPGTPGMCADVRGDGLSALQALPRDRPYDRRPMDMPMPKTLKTDAIVACLTRLAARGARA